MRTSMTYPNGHGPNGATKFALFAPHPKWREVDSHPGMFNDLEDDGLDPDPARKNWAMAGSRDLRELREGDIEVIRERGHWWDLDVGPQPNGWPFISLHTAGAGITQACGLLISGGEARVLAAQLGAAADPLDLA